MSYPYYRDLWPQVRMHSWKFAPRTQPIDALLWHATRGGQGYPGTIELDAYCNWAVSPNNRRPSGYAGIANVGIGPQGVVLCVPLEMRPTHSSWPSDEHAISIEVAQSDFGQPIEAATIEHCARFAEYCRAQFGIPQLWVFPTNDRQWKGEAGHEDTVQGKSQGKSDPGFAFWHPYIATWAKEDDEMGMTAEELARMERLERHLFGAQPGERMSRLETDQRLDLEGRVSRLEDNNGPIGRRLAALEEHVDKHPTEGFTVEDIERLAVDAVTDKLTGVDR